MIKTLEIIAVTWSGHMPGQLPCFVYSLISQTSKDFVCRIYHDGPATPECKQFMSSITEQWPDNFEFIESATRADVFGHQNREKGLDKASSPLLHMTNCDNYQVPLFVDCVLATFKSNPKLEVVTFPIVHSYGKYCWFDGSEFRIARTDMASFVIRTDLAKEAGFYPSDGMSWRKKEDFAADGHFIERVRKRRGDKLVRGHLGMGLVVHN